MTAKGSFLLILLVKASSQPPEPADQLCRYSAQQATLTEYIGIPATKLFYHHLKGPCNKNVYTFYKKWLI